MNRGLIAILLLATLACSAPRSAPPREPAPGKVFALAPQAGRNTIIWDRHAVPPGPLEGRVVAELRDKGFQLGHPEQADLWLSLRAFAPDAGAPSAPVILVVEVVERVSQRVVWSGQRELSVRAETARPGSPNELAMLLADFPQPR